MDPSGCRCCRFRPCHTDGRIHWIFVHKVAPGCGAVGMLIGCHDARAVCGDHMRSVAQRCSNHIRLAYTPDAAQAGKSAGRKSGDVWPVGIKLTSVMMSVLFERR